jgi:SAM-dependent methyltransferase
MSHYDFDAWCERVPGIRKASDGKWVAVGDTPISFPLESHTGLADIETQSYWFKHRNTAIAAMVGQFAPSGPILDVGGGNGFVSMGLRDAGFASFVVEPGPAAVDMCEARAVPVIQAAFQDIAFKPESLDAVAMFDVLEHIDDEESILRQLHQILKPHGMLYLTVPAYSWLWSQEDVGAGHFRRYTLGGLTDNLARVGFKVEFASYMFAVLVLPVLLLRSLPSLIGRRTKVNHEQSAREHNLPSNAIGRAIEMALAREGGRIALGKRVRFGTSCLIAARTQKPAQSYTT